MGCGSCCSRRYPSSLLRIVSNYKQLYECGLLDFFDTDSAWRYKCVCGGGGGRGSAVASACVCSLHGSDVSVTQIPRDLHVLPLRRCRRVARAWSSQLLPVDAEAGAGGVCDVQVARAAARQQLVAAHAMRLCSSLGARVSEFVSTRRNMALHLQQLYLQQLQMQQLEMQKCSSCKCSSCGSAAPQPAHYACGPSPNCRVSTPVVNACRCPLQPASGDLLRVVVLRKSVLVCILPFSEQLQLQLQWRRWQQSVLHAAVAAAACDVCCIRRKCFARGRGAAATAVTHIVRCLCTCQALRLQLLHQPQPQQLQGAGGWREGGGRVLWLRGAAGL